MSLIKDLRSKEENQLNIVDVVSLIVPDGKTKYIEMLLNILRDSAGIEMYKKQLISELKEKFLINESDLNKYDPIQIIQISKFLNDTFDNKDLKDFIKFCRYNERNLIEDNDISKIKKFKKVSELVELAEIKITEKEMEKQIIKLFENDTWLVLKPLTYEASKKYGANTKWCTSSESTSTHFNSYTENGILIYSINKKNGYRIATHKQCGSNGELTFWNQVDTKIDSLSTDLPIEILQTIKEHLKGCSKPNKDFTKDIKSTDKWGI